MSPRFSTLAFLASSTPAARHAAERLSKRYKSAPLEEADAIIVLGGDGFMLQTLHKTMDKPRPIYGMNFGSVGFLMNPFREDDLYTHLEQAHQSLLHPLRMTAHTAKGDIYHAYAINEVSMLRQTHQAARLRIKVDGQVRLEELVADGILVATPAGSTAYNCSVNGPIIPLSASLLALTPISAFRPRRWRGALLPDAAHICIDVLESRKRPVSAVADHTEFRHVTHVEVIMDSSISLTILHDPGHSFEERILHEQFRE
jgi:NAD+ kinase